MKKLCFILGSAIFLGLIALWATHGWLGAGLIRRALARQGMTVTAIEPVRLEGRTLVLPLIRALVKPLPTVPLSLYGTRLTLTMESLTHPTVAAATIERVEAGNVPLKVELDIQNKRAQIALPPTRLSDANLGSVIAALYPTISKAQLNGTLAATLTYSPADVTLAATLSDGKASLQGLPLIGISASGTFRLVPMISSVTPTTIQIEQIDSPVPIQDIRLTANSAQVADGGWVVDVRSARATLFDGVASLAPFQWRSDSPPPSSLTVNARNLDLGAIFALYPQSTIQGTGRLRVFLPLTITKDGVRIIKGTIRADPPKGVLRVTLPDGALPSDAHEQADLVRRSLQNFVYSRLEADVSAEPSGAVHLATRLTGGNPDVNKGREMNVNIGIEENVLELLRSIRAARDVAEQL